MDKKNKIIGMRNLKTAIAVAISVLVAKMLSLESPFYTSIAAIISMQNSVEKGFKAGKDRMIGTLAGAAIGIIASTFDSDNILIISFGLIVIITILNYFKLKDSISIAGVVYCAINLNLNGESGLTYAVYRTCDTLIGVIIAICINKLIYPPKSKAKIIFDLKSLVSNINTLCHNALNIHKFEGIDEVTKNIIILQEYLNLTYKENKEDDKNFFKMYAQKIIDLSIYIISYLNIYKNNFQNYYSEDKNEIPFLTDCITTEMEIRNLKNCSFIKSINKSVIELNELWEIFSVNN